LRVALLTVVSVLIFGLGLWLFGPERNGDEDREAIVALRDEALEAFAGGRRKDALRAVDACLEKGDFPSGEFWSRLDSLAICRDLLDVTGGLRDFERLERIGVELAKRWPELPDGHAAAGRAAHAMGQLDLARDSFERVILLSASAEKLLSAARVELATVLRKSGDVSNAIDEVIRVLLEDPYSRRGYLELGACLEACGAATARKLFELARQLEPADAEERKADQLAKSGKAELAARHRARAESLRGRFLSARRILEDAAEVSAGGAVFLVEHLVDSWRASEATTVLEGLALSLGADHPDVVGWRAIQRARSGEPGEGVRGLLSLLKRSPASARIWGGRLAEIVAIDLGRPDKALPWLEMLGPRGDLRARELAARIYLDLDRPREAARLFSRGASTSRSDLADLLCLRARLLIDDVPSGVEKRLARFATTATSRPEYEMARAAWLAESGRPASEIQDAKRRARHLEQTRGEARAELIRASSLSGEEAERAFIAAAGLFQKIDAREESIRALRIATAIRRASAEVWKQVAARLDRDEEVFLWLEARREARIDVDASDEEIERDVRERLLRGVEIPKLRTAPAPAVVSKSADGEAEWPGRVRFTDVSSSSGIDFRHVAGSAEKDFIIGINGGGVALFDYDRDGLTDVFLVNGSTLEPSPQRPTDRLYRNLGDLRFEDVTEAAGLIESSWGCGAISADYDNDGDPDLFVTNWGPDRLWRNEGNGKFTDATEVSGVRNERWGSSATFFDYDRDGHLDLFIANYLDFDPRKVRRRGNDPSCEWRGVPVACGPNGLPPVTNVLYRNRGGGTFEDVSDRAGITSVDSRFAAYALGVVVVDSDSDGWPDLFVANDTRGNLLYRNRGDGTFEEVGTSSGVAFNDDGMAQSGMGVDAVFLGGRVVEDLFVTNFADDTNTYYRNEGDGLYSEATGTLGLAGDSFRHLGWGAFFFDAEGDGDQDLFVANGHVAPQVDELGSQPGYAQENQLFLQHEGKFRWADSALGDESRSPRVSRGAAFGDLDRDGDPDIVVHELDAPATVLRNESEPVATWLVVRLRGTKSNRDGIGAVVTLRSTNDVQRRRIRCGSSYASQSELVARFGLGIAGGRSEALKDVTLRVDWPSGRIDEFPGPFDDRSVMVVEGTGISR